MYSPYVGIVKKDSIASPGFDTGKICMKYTYEASFDPRYKPEPLGLLPQVSTPNATACAAPCMLQDIQMEITSLFVS